MAYKSSMLGLFLIMLSICVSVADENEDGVIYANKCEVCKIMAIELESRLAETGKSNNILEIGYHIDDVKPKKRKEYRKSHLRLIESLENICDRILEYNIHKERTDSTRFAKGMSQTFQTLHGLVDKGVKVDLGIPLELWDKPNAEITNMKSQCETLLEEYEDDIEDWYFQHQGDKLLKSFLCEERILKGLDTKCLSEQLKGDKSALPEVKKPNSEL